MKNPKVISEKYWGRALTVSSTVCLLAFGGCARIDGWAENHGVSTNLQVSPIERDQAKASNQSVSLEPDLPGSCLLWQRYG
jgi:hypothetical protein